MVEKILARGTLLRQIIVIALVALQALILAWLAESALSDALMTRAMGRVTGPFMGLFYKEGSRNELLVVHIDQPSLDAAGSSWPQPYRYHARMLRALAAYEPKSIFVDLTFDSARPDPTLAQLTQTICDLNDRGIRIFLAAPASDAGSRLRDELEAIRMDENRSSGCFTAVGVEQVRDSFDRIAWTYPLYSRPGTEGELQSAALTIAKSRRPDTDFEVESPNERMSLFWGTKASKNGLNWVSSATDSQPGDSAAPPQSYCKEWSIGMLFPTWARAVFEEKPPISDPRPICVFHDSVSAQEVLKSKTEQETNHLAELVRGRAILYGASFNNGDFTISPLHDEIPGIYLHAMALDNLLEFGSQWKRSPTHPKLGEWIGLYFLYFAVSLLLAFAVWLGEKAWQKLEHWLPAPLGGSGGKGEPEQQDFAMKILQAKAETLRNADTPLHNKVFTVLGLIGLAMLAGNLIRVVRFLAILFIPGVLIFMVVHELLNLGPLVTAEIIAFCSAMEALHLREKIENAINILAPSPETPDPGIKKPCSVES